MDSIGTKEKKIYQIMSLALFLICLIALTVTGSYAYFAAKINANSDGSAIVTTANLKATFSDGKDISLTNALPGAKTSTKTITFTNTGSEKLNYSINWKNLTNGGLTGLKYTITCDSSDITGTGTNLSMPTSATSIISGTIAPNVTHTCNLQIAYTDTGADQTAEKGKTFTVSLEATASPVNN